MPAPRLGRRLEHHFTAANGRYRFSQRSLRVNENLGNAVVEAEERGLEIECGVRARQKWGLHSGILFWDMLYKEKLPVA